MPMRWFLRQRWRTSLAVAAMLVLLWLPGSGQTAPGQPSRPQPLDLSGTMPALVEADWIEEDRLFQQRGRGVELVTTTEDAAGGCDGVKTGRWGFHTASGETDPWWQVDLGRVYALDRVVVFNRTDSGTAPRTRNLQVWASESGREFDLIYQHPGEVFYGVNENRPLVVPLRQQNVRGRFMRLQVPGRCSFALDEVEVYSQQEPEKNIALNRPADQKSVGPYSVAHPTPTSSFTLTHIRQVVDRAQALAHRLVRQGASSEHLDPLMERLRELERRLERLEQSDPDVGTRRRLYLAARRLAREVAFCNPRLDFDRILFIKRHDAGGVFHMCDQYYGFNARPGGGLFILQDPFGLHPQLIPLLENSVVEKGRLQGEKLSTGAFLSPNLSFDGRAIVFAYTEAKGMPTDAPDGRSWSPSTSYHLFRVNSDGAGLVQLTDGPWNDFDPCFLPNGRIVFVSERRGGFLRCGRYCPVYTLHSMAADGSDIACLSFHETHEWHPSVTPDGMIVYTRWDYVDRDTNIAHHLWTCFPDGRSPRAIHGNYPTRREGRPWMVMSPRAIPGSHKFVGTAAAHHGHAFGSLVLIDPYVPDDGGMAQVTRLTPEVPFPEAENKNIAQGMIYGTPYPLSEDDYLCVYDSQARNRGIYWIDRYGNRELLYRDPAISCLSPLPLRPQPVPPCIPDQAGRLAGPLRGQGLLEAHHPPRPSAIPLPKDGSDQATVAVMNVYRSDRAWPEGTRIAALRILQLLPKTTAPPNQPRIGVAEQTNARAVLGTVPVEADGSAYFRVPAGRPVYFQALDERQMAIQSMRSVTYFQPGEQAACQGCHEPLHQAPAAQPLPLALRRPPSELQPPPEGANPFSYVRLVQPVLDRHCVPCHQRKKALDLTGAIEGSHGWTRSYIHLAGRYGFYFQVSNGAINMGVHGGSRTIPGHFGARAAPLLRYLDEGHHGVKLPPEDFQRITLWLDCNSEFLGAYEDAPAQARGEVIPPALF